MSAKARPAPGWDRGLLAILAMAVAGCAVAAYLTAVHYTPLPLACPTTGVIDCARVTSSPYAVVPGTTIPITIPGLLWFLTSGILAAAGLRRWRHGRADAVVLRALQLAWATAGLLVVLVLVYVEIVLLRRICEWCTAAHLLIFGTFLVALHRLQAAPPADEREATDGGALWQEQS